MKPRDRPGSAHIYPGYFALVMATGIISIATGLMGWRAISLALLAVGVVAHFVLIGLYGLWALYDGDHMRRELTDARTMFAFFTFVAANGTLGARCLMAGLWDAGWILWALAAAAWIALIYVTSGSLIFKNTQPLSEAVNGSWLVAIVGTQSVVILSAQLAPRASGWSQILLAGGYTLWAIGIVLYVLFISFILERLAFSKVNGEDLTGPYWINMGATAISTLAGATLYAGAQGAPSLRPLAPVLYGVTWGLWAWGTWWIPILLAMGFWKHVMRRVSLTYDPSLWSMVFPLGMYTVATLKVGVMTHLSGLIELAHIFIWVALAAWTAMFVGLMQSLKRRFIQNKASHFPTGGLLNRH